MDQNYWEDYYSNQGKDINNKSTFAEFCCKNYFCEKEMKIIDIGSGNGRDAIYFAHHNHKVIAIDQSTIAIDIERENIHDDIKSNLFPIAHDFIDYDYSRDEPIDVFYSRFTLHAISKKDENLILPIIYNNLSSNGLFCIEARTTKDPIFGIGEDCGDNAFRTDHYRRFIDSQLFLKNMLRLGFELLFFTEKNNLSIYKNDNPVLMRVILRKK